MTSQFLSRDPNATASEKLCKEVQEGFSAYRTTQQRDKLPLVSVLWEKYQEHLTIDTVLRPIVRGCQQLIDEHTSGNNHFDALTHFYKEIRVLHKPDAEPHERIDLSFVLAWLAFHRARLRGLTLSRDDIGHHNEWLRKCYNLGDRRATHFFALFGLNRDAEMLLLVFNEQGKVRDFFYSEVAPGSVYLPRVAGWFLRRYDLDPAFALLRTLTPGESRTDTILRHRLGCNFWRRNWKAFLFTSLLLFFVAAAALLELSARWPASVIWTSQQLHVPWGGNPWKDLPFVQTRCFLVYFIGSGILFLTVFRAIVAWLWRKQLFDNIRQLLPRLAAGVLVGYLPLMTTSDLWKWLLRMPTIAAGLLALMMLVVSLGYLYVEARSAVIDGELPDIMRKELWIRVSRVFLVGLSETLLIGFVLSEFFGQTVVLSLRDDLENIPVIAVTGWVGYIFPKVVLFYAPFALFFGILVQLIWDEKTVAQPL